MKYLCLRDCYVYDRFWHQGETYELPDDMEKSEKNFKPVELPEPELALESEPLLVVANAPEKPRELKPSEYLCSKCKTLHRESSKLGRRHLKYKEVV